MVENFLVYLIVAVAAAFVVWRVLLPTRAKAALRRATGGAGETCYDGQEGGACSGGCSGCGLSKPQKR